METKEIDTEAVCNGIDGEGFDYYMTNYAARELKGTAVWPAVEQYLAAKKALEVALIQNGVELDR